MANTSPSPPDLRSAEELVRRRTGMRNRIEGRISQIEEKEDRDGGSGRAATALATLYRQLRLAEEDVTQAEWVAHTYRQANPEDLPEATYLEELRAAAGGMVEQHLRVFVDVWLERHEMVAVVEDEIARARFDAARPSVGR